jgi:hypothetical protein
VRFILNAVQQLGHAEALTSPIDADAGRAEVMQNRAKDGG